jgi:isopentenyl diphosphate isomerase/L-lactate dehydrogenase-like FMN-dependent dehydrogenase
MVARAIEVMRKEISLDMALLGIGSLDELSAADHLIRVRPGTKGRPA